MNIKEIVIASVGAVSLGLGVMNLVGNRKNKKNIGEMEKKIIEMNTPRGLYGFSQFQNPQPHTTQPE